MAPAISICDMSQPPKISPVLLASLGKVLTRKITSRSFGNASNSSAILHSPTTTIAQHRLAFVCRHQKRVRPLHFVLSFPANPNLHRVQNVHHIFQLVLLSVFVFLRHLL